VDVNDEGEANEHGDASDVLRMPNVKLHGFEPTRSGLSPSGWPLRQRGFVRIKRVEAASLRFGDER
jgi:hypothetical protein